HWQSDNQEKQRRTAARQGSGCGGGDELVARRTVEHERALCGLTSGFDNIAASVQVQCGRKREGASVENPRAGVYRRNEKQEPRCRAKRSGMWRPAEPSCARRRLTRPRL